MEMKQGKPQPEADLSCSLYEAYSIALRLWCQIKDVCHGPTLTCLLTHAGLHLWDANHRSQGELCRSLQMWGFIQGQVWQLQFWIECAWWVLCVFLNLLMWPTIVMNDLVTNTIVLQWLWIVLCISEASAPEGFDIRAAFRRTWVILWHFITL